MLLIETSRLLLQPFSIEDAAEYYWVVKDPAIRQYLPYAGFDSFEKVEQLVASYCNGDFKNDFYLEIFDMFHGKIVGGLIANRLNDPDSLDVCYLIEQTYRNRGYAKEAVKGFANYLRDNRNYQYSSLTFTIRNDNEISQRVVKSLGANQFLVEPHSTTWRMKIH